MKKTVIYTICLMLAVMGLSSCGLLPQNDSHRTDTANTPTEGMLSNDDQYKYSTIEISSGGSSINPISCLVWMEMNREDDDGMGQTICADGSGVWGLRENDPSAFPTLVRNGTVEVTRVGISSRVSGAVKIYDMDFQEIDINSSFDALSTLEDGRYLIVFEESIDDRGLDASRPNDYTRGVDECVFVLVVN